MYIAIAAAVIIAVYFLFGLSVIQEYQKTVVFIFGRYTGIKGPGIIWTPPLISKKITVDIRTKTVDVDAQDTVTRDSVTIRVDAVLYYRITDPKKAILAVADYRKAIFQASLTVLHNVIGQNNLDDVLKNRDEINTSLRTIVDEITDPWGLKVELVEMKDVEIPEAMQRAMAKEAEAVREKRARIIKAQGESEASKMLSDAALDISKNPLALELRRMQMITEVGAEHNTTTIMLLPSEFVTMAKSISDKFSASSVNTVESEK
ncbi:MAG TPA: slipin family protein [Bacillota bacterium]|nr:slipin family protein [Bacillota bacterium]